jgi:hypothetical protein
MFNSPFSYFAPSSRQSFYPTHSRGNQKGSFFYQEPNFWEYDQQAAAEQEYRERLAQLRYEEQRRNAYLRRQKQLEEQYRLQQQKEHEQEMLEEQQRLKQLKAKKEKRRQRKERHLKRISITKDEQPKSEIEQDKIVHQPHLPKREPEPQSDNDMFFDAFTGNFNESETEHETEPESAPASPSYNIGTASDNISINSPYSSSSESDSSTYTSTLKTLESKINANVDVYNRINSAISRDTCTPKTTTLNSRLKVVQRAQIELEKLYEKLDDLDAAPTPRDKQLKQQLTKTAVSYADKTELLFKTIKKLLDEAKAAASPKKRVLLESVPDEDLSC